MTPEEPFTLSEEPFTVNGKYGSEIRFLPKRDRENLLKLPSRHGGTLNSRRAASPLKRLVEEEVRWEAPDHLQCVLPQNWGGKGALSYCHLYGAQSYG
ncbi:hypothetical protein TNCV_973901 [Trichonephila clavipes]|nr:hypothetical protein TNCV_973901 [Trichonephila clavipes]